MKIYKIYDNGGKTLDRYIVLKSPVECLSVDGVDGSDFSQWGACVDGSHLGKEIGLEDLPEAVRKHVLGRLA
jgi:hypothetical protein